jgi:hypothetical protein
MSTTTSINKMHSQNALAAMLRNKLTCTIAWKSGTASTPVIMYGEFSRLLAVSLSAYCRDNLRNKTSHNTVRVAVPPPDMIPTIIDVVGVEYSQALAVFRWMVEYAKDVRAMPRLDNTKPTVAQLAALLATADFLVVPILSERLRNKINEACKTTLSLKELRDVLAGSAKDTFAFNAASSSIAAGVMHGRPSKQNPDLLGLMREFPAFAADLKRRVAVLEEEKRVKQKAMQDARERRRVAADHKPRSATTKRSSPVASAQQPTMVNGDATDNKDEAIEAVEANGPKPFNNPAAAQFWSGFHRA